MNIAANMCFLSYSVVHEQWPIALNNIAVVTLDGTLLYMRCKFRSLKKRHSETDLTMLS